MTIVLVILIGLLQGSPAVATQADLEAVKQIEQHFTSTLMRKDEVAFSKLLADDIVHIGFDGQTVGKAEYMSFFKVGVWQYKKYEPGNVSIKMLGNVAVVTGQVDRTIVIDSKETSGALAFTHVWTKTSHGWLLTSSQLTRIPAEQ